MPHHLRTGTTILLAGLLLSLRLAYAQKSVAFIYPPPQGSGTRNHFFPNQDVTFQFTSTYPLLTLELWQGPDGEGNFGKQALLPNVDNATHTNVTWLARVLPGHNRSEPLWLHLYNANNPDCAGCSTNSSKFTIVAKESNATPTASPAPSADNRQRLRLGLGLGLGLGIPLLILLSALITWLCLRKRKRQEDDGRASEEPLADWKAPPEYGGHSQANAFVSPVSAEDYTSEHPEQKMPRAEADGLIIGELPAAGREVIQLPAGDQRMELPGSDIERHSSIQKTPRT